MMAARFGRYVSGCIFSTIASLSLAQSQDQFLENLGEVKSYYEQIMRKALAYPNAADFGFTGGSSNNGAPLTDPAGIF